MAIPGNLLSPTTEMVDPDTSGWRPVLNCTKALGTGGRNGDGCLALTAALAAEMRAETAATYPVVPGALYETFADASSTSQPERIGIQWLDAHGSEISITWSLTTNTASTAWHRVSVAGFAPEGSAAARVMLSATAAVAHTVSFFENVYLGAPLRTSGNLFSFNAESGGEIDTSGWTAGTNTTLGRDVPAFSWPVDWYYAGGHTITVTAAAAGTASVVAAETPAVTPGQAYTAHCYLNPPTSTAQTWVELRWLDAAGALISAVRSTLAQPGTGIYQQIVSGTAPANAAMATLAAGITSATAGQKLRIEGAVLAAEQPLAPGSVVPQADADFEQGVGSWTVASGPAAIARSTPWGAQSWTGFYSLTVTASTTSASVLTSAHYPVTPGQTWRAQISVKPIGGNWDVLPLLRWYDASGADLGSPTDTAATVPAGQWWDIWSDLEPPAAAASARFEIQATASSTSSTLQIDTARLRPVLSSFQITADDDLGRVELILRELIVGETMRLYRLVGGTQSLVRGPAGWLTEIPVASEQFLVDDYEAPLGVPVTYRAESYDAATGALTGYRVGGPVTLAVPDPSDCWLKDPLQPQRNVRLRASVAPDWTRPIEQTSYRIRGRRNSVVLSDVRQGLTGTLQVWTLTDDERRALHFALDTGDPLLVQFSPGLGLEDAYYAVGDADEPRFSPVGSEPRRRWSLPLTQVDAPPGGAVGTSGWTVQDVVATWDTALDLLDAYVTVLDLATDTRVEG